MAKLSAFSSMIPLLPLIELVVYPHNETAFLVGRKRSLAALDAARGQLALFTQLRPSDDEPAVEELAGIGVVASVQRTVPLLGGNKRVYLDVTARVRISAVKKRKNYIAVELADVSEITGPADQEEMAEVRQLYLQLIGSSGVSKGLVGKRMVPSGALLAALLRQQESEDITRWELPLLGSRRSELPVFLATEDPGMLADAVAHRLSLDTGRKIALLEEVDKSVRLSMLKRFLEQEVNNREFEIDLNEKVRQATRAQHREIFLREQLRQVLQELGEGAPLALHNPVFKGRGFRSDQRLAFVLMPFDSAFRPIYDEIIKPILEAHGLRSVRADDIYGPQAIIEDIWRLINEASLIVADLSGKNPNVFYEVGLAHAVGKDVVFLSQSMEDVPFDLRHLRCILYTDSVAGFKKLQRGLAETLATLQLVIEPRPT